MLREIPPVSILSVSISFPSSTTSAFFKSLDAMEVVDFLGRGRPPDATEEPRRRRLEADAVEFLRRLADLSA